MYNSMIEAIKEETVQLLFHIDIKQVATTDEAVDEVEETAESADTIAVASGPDENGESVVEAAEGEVEEEDEDTDAKQAIAESAAASGPASPRCLLPDRLRSATPKARSRFPSVRRAKSSRRRGPTAAPSLALARTPRARAVPAASTRCATARTRSDASLVSN